MVKCHDLWLQQTGLIHGHLLWTKSSLWPENFLIDDCISGIPWFSIFLVSSYCVSRKPWLFHLKCFSARRYFRKWTWSESADLSLPFVDYVLPFDIQLSVGEGRDPNYRFSPAVSIPSHDLNFQRHMSLSSLRSLSDRNWLLFVLLKLVELLTIIV